jgi:tetratricopeptide (TPR) repeat protein
MQIATGMLFRGDADAAEAELRPLLGRPQLEGQRNTISLALIRVDVFRGRYRAAIAALGEAADAALAAGDRHEATLKLFWRAIVQAAGPGDTLAARDTVARLRSLEPNFDYFFVLADLDDAQGAEALGYVNDQFSDLLISALRARLSGRVAEAMTGYERLANAPYIGAQIRFTLARLQLEAGKPREAIATLKRLQSTYPGVRVLYWDPELWFPRSYYLLGLAHERAGDAPAALASYQRFLSLWKDADPELKELQDAKARVTTLRSLVPR